MDGGGGGGGDGRVGGKMEEVEEGRLCKEGMREEERRKREE